MFVDKE